MSKIITFSKGGKIEILEDGCIITSNKGKTIRVQPDGTIIDNVVKPKSEEDELNHFFLIGEEERIIIRDWYKKVDPKSEKQRKFIVTIGEALHRVTYDYMIATLEPSNKVDYRGCQRIKYETGNEIEFSLSAFEWEEAALYFMPERGSRLANIYELYLFYAYRIAKGFFDISSVCDNSRGVGNYSQRITPYDRTIRKTGSTKVGGFYDGIGNTRKIVNADNKREFLLVGGDFVSDGLNVPMAQKVRVPVLDIPFGRMYTGVVVLTGVN